jgi:hypothetical protein
MVLAAASDEDEGVRMGEDVFARESPAGVPGGGFVVGGLSR